MKKLVPITILLAVILSACGSNNPSEEKNTGTASESKVSMDDGPLNPKQLDVKELVVSATLPACANEEFPVQGEVYNWDFDKDGATDAVAVSRCPSGDERTTFSVARATSRGWWPTLNIGGLEDTLTLTGDCKASGDNFRCPVSRLNPDTKVEEKGSIEVFYAGNALMYRFLLGE
jgi:hypothetical protein